ncbi:hypothetical protein Efla_007349 [Eimeria flavescens]
MTADVDSLKKEGADLTESAAARSKAGRKEKDHHSSRGKDRRKGSSSSHKSVRGERHEEAKAKKADKQEEEIAKNKEEKSLRKKEEEDGGHSRRHGSKSRKEGRSSSRTDDKRRNRKEREDSREGRSKGTSRKGDRADRNGEHKHREKEERLKKHREEDRHGGSKDRRGSSSSKRHRSRSKRSEADRRHRRRERSADRRRSGHSRRRGDSERRGDGSISSAKRKRNSQTDEQLETERTRETKRSIKAGEAAFPAAAFGVTSAAASSEVDRQLATKMKDEEASPSNAMAKTQQASVPPASAVAQSTPRGSAAAGQHREKAAPAAAARQSPSPRRAAAAGQHREKAAPAAAARQSPSPPRGGMRYKSRSNSRGRERRSPSYGAYRGRDVSVEREEKKADDVGEPEEEADDDDEVFDLSLTGGRFGELLDQPVTCSVEGGNLPIPEPADTLDGCKDGQKPLLDPLVVENLKKLKCRWLLPIQRYAIPIVGRGHDLLGSAATGCGKTLAFLAPLVSKVIACAGLFRPHFPGSHAQASPLSVVLCPTRELAIQIDEQLDRLMAGSSLSHSLWIGGVSATEQVHEINQRQIDVAICTPGRVDELCLRGKVTLEFVQLLVLDEADAMLDLGFQKVMTELATSRDMPENRQTLLFSATFPPNLQSILPSILRTPYFRVEEVKWIEGWNEKLAELVKDIHSFVESQDSALDEAPGEGGQVIVFVSGKLTVKAVADFLRNASINAETLFGTMAQEQRKQVYLTFRSRKVRALVATSIAARGLDFPDVGLVINFEMPPTIEPYVHRIGRTGRAGRSGRAISYFGQKDMHLAVPLSAHLVKCKAPIPPWLCRLTG